MRKLKRFLVRIFYFAIKFIIIPVESVAPRLYMRVFSKLLSLMGVNFRGEARYISSSVKFDDFDRVAVGGRVVISAKVILLTHDYSYTTAFISQGASVNSDLYKIDGISIGNNVFIGMGTIILPGTVIGDNTIIGAGSVIRGVLPGDSVYAGNPAKKISTIDEIRKKWFPGENSVENYMAD